MLENFKVGDKVICIDDNYGCLVRLEKGKEYIVTDVSDDGDFVGISESFNSGLDWFSNRFILVNFDIGL